VTHLHINTEIEINALSATINHSGEETMKLACADFSFPLLEHESVLQLISMLRVEGVDLALMGNRSHVRPEVVRDDPGYWIKELSRRLEAAQLELADFFFIPWTDFETLAPNHPDATERAASRELFIIMADMAAALNAGGMTFLPGITWPDETRDASFQRAVEELNWRVDEAASRELDLSVEPHLGSFMATPGDVLELVDAVPGLKLTLDYTHFILQGIPERDIDVLAPHARHFHARGATPELLQTTSRGNTIDYDRIVEVLVAAGYGGYLGIEYVWLQGDPPGGPYDLTNTDNVAETILLRDRLRERLGQLAATDAA
jgi:sugar phosphate isomerase/epimerase